MEKTSASVYIKKGQGRALKAGGLWIYDNEIDTITGRFHNGDMVTIHDFDGYPMGNGFINQNSKIRIRMMTREQDQLIDEDFLRRLFFPPRLWYNEGRTFPWREDAYADSGYYHQEETWSAADARGNYLFRARSGGQDHSGLSAGGAADGDSLEWHDSKRSLRSARRSETGT